MHRAESAESYVDIGWLLEQRIHHTELNLTSVAWPIWSNAQFLDDPFLTWWLDHKPLIVQCTNWVSEESGRQYWNRALFQILAAGPNLTFWSQHTWSIRLDGLICLMQRSSHDYANSDQAVSPSAPHTLSITQCNKRPRSPAIRLFNLLLSRQLVQGVPYLS